MRYFNPWEIVAMMSLRKITGMVLLVAVLSSGAEQSPNIIVILADDLGCYGADQRPYWRNETTSF
jgi:hypothetical protein